MLGTKDEFLADDDLNVPNDFLPADQESFLTPSSRGRFYMQEEIVYWIADDRNIFSGTGFKGTGYAKLVKRAVTKGDRTLPHDDNGKPIFFGDDDRDPVH